MPAPASVISHGENDFLLRAEVLSRRSGQPDALEQLWCVTDPSTYQIGAAAPDHADMRIIEIEPQDTYTGGGSTAISLRAEGIDSGAASKLLDHGEDLPQEGWDIIQRRVYTREPNAAHLLKGGQLMDTPRTSVSADASTNIFTKTAHGLVSGQLADLTFASGFGGATSGTRYLICKLDADTLHLLGTAATYVTGAASTNVLTKASHGLTDGTAVVFPVLRGGAGLSTWTVYYVRDATTNTFKLAATAGGAAIDFTTDITQGTGVKSQLRRVLDLSTSGTGGTLTPVMLGYERLWITSRRKNKARGCVEAEALGLTGYYELDLELKGLNQVEGETKKITRRLQGAAQALSIQNFSAATLIQPQLYGDTADLSTDGTKTSILGGKVEFDLPQVGMTETMILTEEPPLWLLGAGISGVPNDTPSVSYVSLTGASDTLLFPSGWVPSNIQTEQIPGQQLWLCTWTWINRRDTLPGE